MRWDHNRSSNFGFAGCGVVRGRVIVEHGDSTGLRHGKRWVSKTKVFSCLGFGLGLGVLAGVAVQQIQSFCS